jgi:ABC-type dipeptide/oligopeptide/nickel transport system permease component
MVRFGYVTRRIAGALATIFVATTLNFFLFRLAPGNAAELSRVPGASPALEHALTREFGLNKPLLTQYLSYLRQLVHLNLGVSFSTQRPVSQTLATAIANTLPMVGVGLVIALGIAVSTGLVAAWFRGTLADQGLRGAALMFYALPAQWLGMMLILLFHNWLPSAGMSDPFLINPNGWTKLMDELRHMILPATTFALVAYGGFMIIIRNSLLQTMSEDYILMARAKGLSSRVVMQRHALRNALLPATTLVALMIGSLVGGVILIETTFSWPGIGQTVYEAIGNRDYPVLEGAFLVLAVSVVLCNLAADLLYTVLDPRVRLS